MKQVVIRGERRGVTQRFNRYGHLLGATLWATMLALLVVSSASLSSCTYYVPATLYMTRTGDTLSVALDPVGRARWDPRKDSLIVECQGCDPARSRVVEYFEDRNEAQFEIAHTQGLTLTLYSMGRKDTMVVVSGTGTAEAGAPTPTLRNLGTHRRHPATASETETAATPPKQATAQEKTVKKVATLKVTASEGVAVYKDKTKTEVLKILPQGTVMQLLSREGDLLSVAIDGGEGFVEAEAVQIQE